MTETTEKTTESNGAKPAAETRKMPDLRILMEAFTDYFGSDHYKASTPMPSVKDIARQLAEMEGLYPIPNLAVELCCGFYLDMKKKQIDEGKSEAIADRVGRLAYCSNLPKLSSREEITDFIACVTHGLAIGIIGGSDGARLIYAAQVASSTLPSPKARKKKHKTAQKQPPSAIPTPVQSAA